MSEFLIGVLRIAYLAVLWAFILLAVNVIRTDIFGHSVARGAEGHVGTPATVSTGRRRHRLGHRKADRPATLQIMSGDQAGLEIPLIDTIVIGRGGGSTLVIEDDYASTEHAEISQGFDGLWFVEDLTSTNGTYVNGQNIEELTRLDVDDEVRIGRTVMVVRGQR
ncbi:MAG: FHA domain-containing protein [Cutibacterium granulosum]|uniref:FHA domain-containing protein FhaB/FipA n=1 Tax=Cutibacterium granulosum TaxID=33011 RepID=UPI002B237050|nr:FHA domain-containing protein [Cutibacterium granulosum]MEA5634939.1 FHA domain-containing protein [Cutibacterium granulosum]MEA5648903.1 FHA domain-containing protein [Cutibacterium granulosum]MEA5659499.1 FHA domain-containing protein [Cutibacterium granulosum]MEA5660687.1 FHA domain-containing protein [Cutibacterium granulosum]MEA5663211.1 FHA domain-containing protein [Cutibacterium granulosum]